MKKYLLSLLCVATMVACAPKNRIIENPLIDASNTSTVDIARVEMTDSTTVLNVEVYFHPKQWVLFAKDTYLQVGEQKFQILSAEGVKLGKKFWMPESGRASFVMTFPAIPRDTKSFDFIEGDCEDCFKLYGIDLTGKKSYSKFHPDLPKEYRKKIRITNELPQAEYKFGKTTINIHLLGYRKGYAKKLMSYVCPMFGDEEEIVYFNIDQETGVASKELMLYGNTCLNLRIPNEQMYRQYFLNIGETNDIYIDLRATGNTLVARRKGEENSLQLAYTKGKFAELNKELGKKTIYFFFDCLEDAESNFLNGVTTPDNYVKRVEEKYRNLSDSITKLNVSPLHKKYLQLTVDAQLLEAATYANSIMYHLSKGQERTFKLSDEQVQHLLKPIDLNDDRLMLIGHDILHSYRYRIEQIPADNIYTEYHKATFNFDNLDRETTINLYLQGKKLTWSNNEFFQQACDARLAELVAAMSKDDKNIEPTPDVADDKMLEAIIAPHKGKVVLIDFWNTWCGPCRQMHQIVAQLREENKDLDEVVWIYIANDTSPLSTYKRLIPEIKGLHYRLADKHAGAWTAIGKQLNITGIPSYVLVEKDGSYKLRNDLRGGEEMVSVLRNSLKK